MALVIANRVKETTTTTGTGTVTLLGASTGFQSFAVIGNANTAYYTIAGQTTSEWEVGIGTYTSAGTTLARTTVLSSSNAGAAVNFSAGTKDVFVTYPSEKSVNLDASGNATALGTIASGNLANATGYPGTSALTTVGALNAGSITSGFGAIDIGADPLTAGAVTSTTDATLSGLTVGKGAGAIASNTAVGVNALNANTTGNSNTANGQNALYSNTTGAENTASGVQALQFNTTGGFNTAIGVLALYSNTTGNNNTASGHAALKQNTTGSSNTASGLNALQFNTTGASNTATGVNALLNNTTGSSNTASGVNALLSNTTGANNTASGHSALLSNTTGSSNTASGLNALYSNTTGSSNTASGQSALVFNTTGSGNTALNPLNSAGSYAPVFDPTTENNRFCMGSTAVTDAYIQVAWTVMSDARDKINFAPVPHGLEFVKALQPTAYQFRTARDSEEANGRVRYGFKAQDVLALEGANPVIVDNEDADKLRMIDTAMIPVLVKAIQELNAKFDAYVLTHP